MARDLSTHPPPSPGVAATAKDYVAGPDVQDCDVVDGELEEHGDGAEVQHDLGRERRRYVGRPLGGQAVVAAGRVADERDSPEQQEQQTAPDDHLRGGGHGVRFVGPAGPQVGRLVDDGRGGDQHVHDGGQQAVRGRRERPAPLVVRHRERAEPVEQREHGPAGKTRTVHRPGCRPRRGRGDYGFPKFRRTGEDK